MHSKNGREIKLGDTLVVSNGNYSYVGVAVQLVPNATSCNLYVVPLQNAQCTTAKECVHLSDALKAPAAEE